MHVSDQTDSLPILAEKLASDYNLINLGGLLNVSALRGCWGEDSNPHRTGVAAVRDGNALLLWTHCYVTARGQFSLVQLSE